VNEAVRAGASRTRAAGRGEQTERRGGKSLTGLRGVGSSGRIRTENQPSTPDDPDPIDPELKAT